MGRSVPPAQLGNSSTVVPTGFQDCWAFILSWKCNYDVSNRFSFLTLRKKGYGLLSNSLSFND